MTIDYQKLLQRFQTKAKFIDLVNVRYVSPDEQFYTFDTDQGVFHIYEVDFIDSFKAVQNQISKIINYKSEFIRVRQPLQSFEDGQGYKASTTYKLPEDFIDMAPFLNDKNGSASFYFTFLIKGKFTDKISIQEP